MKGQTNAKLASKGIQGESVNITLLTNQESHSDLIGAVITVSYGGVDTEYVWEGSEVTVKIPAMMGYSISVSEVEGYATPEGFSATSQMGYSRKLEMTYNAELVRVTLSADDSSSVNGQIVTINGEAFTYSGTAVTKKVPFGTEYSVSVNDKSGYITPASQTFTADKSVRDVTIAYKYNPTGIFIQGVSKRLYTADEWNNQEEVNGIAVCTDNCKFVYPFYHNGNIPVQFRKICIWGKEGTLVSGLDDDGNSNTTKIITTLGIQAEAANFCRSIVFPTGALGYLPSTFEWRVAIDNYDEIRNLMLEAFGASLDSGLEYWCSSQYDTEYAYVVTFSSTENITTRWVELDYYAMPFCPFEF